MKNKRKRNILEIVEEYRSGHGLVSSEKYEKRALLRSLNSFREEILVSGEKSEKNEYY